MEENVDHLWLRTHWWRASPEARLLYVELLEPPMDMGDRATLLYTCTAELRTLSAHYDWVLFYHRGGGRLVPVGAVTGVHHSRLGSRRLLVGELRGPEAAA